MATDQTDATKAPDFLSLRRLVLLTSVAAVGGAALFAEHFEGARRRFPLTNPSLRPIAGPPDWFCRCCRKGEAFRDFGSGEGRS